ncbi:unnamed protein product [Linum tenue]|uniref:RNA polymerase sigma-70 domain-containing protein n=1 Tax=Linum tenue TaxID=586396 RepID=A0AAV0IG02_9ROSI|nr:unnamed protein product [Linum tenue]
MMATTAVIGLTAGNRLLPSSFHYCSDPPEKLFCSSSEHGSSHSQFTSSRSIVVAKKSSSTSSSSHCGPGYQGSSRPTHSIKALKDHVDTATAATTWTETNLKDLEEEEESCDVLHSSLEALLLLQRTMLEKQWSLSFDDERADASSAVGKKNGKKKKKVPVVTCSGISARQRRLDTKRKAVGQSGISPELVHNRLTGYVKGVVSEQLLTHAEVVRLSTIIKAGLSLEERKSRLKERLGCDPSDEQLADSLKISRTELHSKQMACSLAREKLAMNNVRLVMSIAQKYDRMGVELADLVQGGLIGLLRGIEKFDSSKGFKMSTYVYWWIRQGVSKALVENSRTLRLPNHLHERLGLIRNAKIRLEEKGITPSIDRIAESLNMSEKKVRNATQAVNKVISMDRDAFPSLNGLPGESHHGYIADNHLENNPWHGVDELALKDEVNKLIDLSLQEREREIIRLYYGLDTKCLTWEDISKRIGLSRERVRQVGLVALEKLKLAARKRKMETMLLKH